MKIEVDKDLLLKSINIADSIVSSKNVNTILSNCLFNIIKNEIEIVSTDNEISMRTKIKAVSDSDDSFTANGKIFSSIIKELPKGLLEIDVNESYVIEVKSKSKDIKGYSRLIGTKADEFPEIPIFKDGDFIEIDKNSLNHMIKKVFHAAAKDPTKPVFHGIYFTSDLPKSITLVATDSRRLSIISKQLDSNIDLKESIIIPLKAANELIRLIDEEGTCKFLINNNQCFFKIGESELVSRIVEGQFPNYKQVVPIEFRIKALIEKEMFTETLRRAIVFTKEPAYKIILYFNKNILTIEAKATDLGESKEEINIESNSDEKISIGLNAQYLLDSIKEIDTPYISIGVTGKMSPVTISPENSDEFLSVIMPIHMK